ncbi:MAG: VWA domain-containing protein [Planctomycetes bacterium]|nr:VWA domain-containing protein [Planctomycetota bacterium]HPY75483.1 VWA domain-containing protein [Planctomycetota bacterium]HQB00323.1 VWA domain-containing protein [Planctomycetota bacterium]
MNTVYYQQLEFLPLFWLLPLLLLVYYYAYKRNKILLQKYCHPDAEERLYKNVYPHFHAYKNILHIFALTFLIITIIRPSWNPIPQKLPHKGRDVVFLLDISNSMLAQDLLPNRLEMAKASIQDCLEHLQGDRVALVAFAGRTVIQCPLTLDYTYFQMQLQNLTTDTIGRGGSMMGDALRTILKQIYTEEQNTHKDIILITDGEDHDSYPLQAAEEIGRKGIRLLAIGLGDETQGQRIPIIDEQGNKHFLQYQGQEVWSKLDADTLRKMTALTPNGTYINVSTGAIDLGKVYQQLISQAEKKEHEATLTTKYEEKYQIFLILTLITLYIQSLIPTRKQSI